MIKKLFFTAALLAPSLAYAASPTADLSVQIVPAGSAPAVPVGALAAGFTTLGVNYDFSQPFYATQSNWLACAGAASPQFWYGIDNGVNGSNPPPCSAIRQAIDPSTGQPVLNMTWLPSYFGGGTTNTVIKTVDAYPPTRGTQFAFGYFEIEYRHTPATTDWNAAEYSGMWTVDPKNGCCGGLEGDAIEIRQTFGSDSCWHTVANGQAGCLWLDNFPHPPAGYSMDQYHKYAMRLTGTGSSNIWQCVWIDNISQGCIQTGFAGFQRNIIAISVGSWSDVGVGPTQNMYIKSFRYWACPNWQTENCNTSSPNP